MRRKANQPRPQDKMSTGETNEGKGMWATVDLGKFRQMFEKNHQHFTEEQLRTL